MLVMLPSRHVVITINKALYAFEIESLSLYFDVIQQSLCTALLQAEHTLNLQWSGGTSRSAQKITSLHIVITSSTSM